MGKLMVTEKLYKCDGCPQRAVTRVAVYPAYLDLCNHHTNKLLEREPEPTFLEDNRGRDYYQANQVRGLPA